MKKIIIGLLLLSVSIAGFAQTEKNFIDQNYIEVTGKAELEISPNMIYLRIVLSDKNNKDKLTLPEIEKKMINKLTEIGIDMKKDLSLMDFASSLRVYIFKTSDVMLTKQYQLIVHDAKTLQKVFFEFQDLGISNVSIKKLDHSQIEQFRKDVKVSAVKAAKEKAEMLATALSQKIGKALYVQEIVNSNSSIAKSNINTLAQGVKYKSSNLPESDEGFDIEFEKIKVESTFLVRFALE
jgi:uncharacterized protein YggE